MRMFVLDAIKSAEILDKPAIYLDEDVLQKTFD